MLAGKKLINTQSLNRWQIADSENLAATFGFKDSHFAFAQSAEAQGVMSRRDKLYAR